MALPSPDDVNAFLTLPFVITYWPLILGAVIVLGLLIKGQNWAAVPVALLFVLLFAWRAGWLA
jgi:hypothetical protein